jgi:hypothetical protein
LGSTSSLSRSCRVRPVTPPHPARSLQLAAIVFGARQHGRSDVRALCRDGTGLHPGGGDLPDGAPLRIGCRHNLSRPRAPRTLSPPPPLFQGSVRWANCTAAAFDLLLTPVCVLLPKPEWWHDGALKTLSKTVVRVVDNGHGHMMRATVLSGLQPAWEVSPRSAADLKEAAKHYSLAAKLASPHGQGHPPSPSGSASAPPQGAPAAAPFRLCGGADLFPGEEERPGQRPGHCAPRHRLVCSSQPVPNSPYPELFRRIRPPRPVVPYRSSNSAIWQPLTSARRPPRKPQRPQRRLQRRRPRPW